MGEFYFMRHGQTQLNQANRYTGKLNYPLNANGILQAIASKGIVKQLDIKRVYSSTLLRAQQTACLVSGIKPILLSHLDERDFGILSGIKKLAYKKTFFPQGESVYIFKNRVKKALLQINLKNTLIVSHSRVYQTICELLELEKSKIQNGEIVKFCKTNNERWTIEKLKDTQTVEYLKKFLSKENQK